MNMLMQGCATKNQKGQAITEYVLLLTISLIIIGGIIYQFNTAFKVYMDAWFLDPDESYLACIIKNGILPDGGDQTGDCVKPKLDLKNGKILAKNNSGRPNGNSKAGDGGGGTNAPGTGRDGTGGRSGDSRSRGGIAYNSADAKNAGLKSSVGKEAKANTGDTGFSSTTGGISGEGGAGAGENIFYSGSRKGKGESENMDEKSSTNVPLNDRDMKSAREIAAEKSKKLKAEQEKEFELSFGNVFKYLIIALLIFSLVFFVGSQFLAVARSKKRK